MPLFDAYIFVNFFVDALRYYSVWKTLCFDLLFLLSCCFRCINYCRIFTELAESLLEVIVDTPSQVRFCASIGNKGFQTLSSYLPPPPTYPPTFLITCLMCTHVCLDFNGYILVGLVKRGMLTLGGEMWYYRNESYYYYCLFCGGGGGKWAGLPLDKIVSCRQSFLSTDGISSIDQQKR